MTNVNIQLKVKNFIQAVKEENSLDILLSTLIELETEMKKADNSKFQSLFLRKEALNKKIKALKKAQKTNNKKIAKEEYKLTPEYQNEKEKEKELKNTFKSLSSKYDTDKKITKFIEDSLGWIKEVDSTLYNVDISMGGNILYINTDKYCESDFNESILLGDFNFDELKINETLKKISKKNSIKKLVILYFIAIFENATEKDEVNIMNNTIQKLKELDLFDEFKSAMEILVEETSKPQIEWDDGGLNCAGLRYNPDFYINIHANHAEGYYENKNEEYLSDVALCSLDPAITDSESFRSAYYIGSYDDFHISSLSFGCIDWNPYWCLKGYRDFDVKEDSWCDYGRYATSNYTEERDEYSKGDYYDYLDKVTDISFSCFEGKTPQEILTILNEVK